MSDLELVDYSGRGDYAWVRPITPRVEDVPGLPDGAGIPGNFENATTVLLRTGHRIHNIVFQYIGLKGAEQPGYHLGWLAGVLYKSVDGGKTWRPSAISFRSA